MIDQPRAMTDSINVETPPPPSAFTPRHHRSTSSDSVSTVTTTKTSSRRKPVSYMASEFETHSNSSDTHSGPAATSSQSSSAMISALPSPTTEAGLVKPFSFHLTADPPLDHATNQGSVRSSSPPPPSYMSVPSTPRATTTGHGGHPLSPTTTLFLASPIHSNSHSTAAAGPLPKYESEPTTEPHTLSRTLFLWGFLCPLLWILGTIILCVPLKVYEEDFEASWDQQSDARREATDQVVVDLAKKRERALLDEKVLIMRKAELRWSRYCAIALACFTCLVIVILAAVLVVVKMT